MNTYANAAAPQGSPANPYFQPAPGAGFNPMSTSPVWAFVLGWIPGVGAIYNGQYVKGLVHAVIFGLMITLIDNAEHTAEPLFALMLAAFCFYMPFEAYHTAKKRQLGLTVEEWSSLVAPNRYASRAPVGPVVLILLGMLFLLDTLRIVEFRDLTRFWPVLLIVMGAFMLYNRVSAPAQAPPHDVPARDSPVRDSMEPRS